MVLMGLITDGEKRMYMKVKRLLFTRIVKKIWKVHTFVLSSGPHDNLTFFNINSYHTPEIVLGRQSTAAEEDRLDCIWSQQIPLDLR